MYKIIEVAGKQIRIDRTQIIGTGFIFYTAWEQTKNDHSSITSEEVEGKVVWWGEIKTRRLPAELDALPAMTEERLKAVQAWRETKYQESYRLILLAFPELDPMIWKQKEGEISNF